MHYTYVYIIYERTITINIFLFPPIYYIIDSRFHIYIHTCRNFLDQFTGDSVDGFEPYYHRQMQIMHRTGNNVFNLNASHMMDFIPSNSLYKQLIQYPQEIIPIMDAVVNEEYMHR